jgi:hypothetical protein
MRGCRIRVVILPGKVASQVDRSPTGCGLLNKREELLKNGVGKRRVYVHIKDQKQELHSLRTLK